MSVSNIARLVNTVAGAAVANPNIAYVVGMQTVIWALPSAIDATRGCYQLGKSVAAGTKNVVTSAAHTYMEKRDVLQARKERVAAYLAFRTTRDAKRRQAPKPAPYQIGDVSRGLVSSIGSGFLPRHMLAA